MMHLLHELFYYVIKLKYFLTLAFLTASLSFSKAGSPVDIFSPSLIILSTSSRQGLGEACRQLLARTSHWSIVIRRPHSRLNPCSTSGLGLRLQPRCSSPVNMSVEISLGSSRTSFTSFNHSSWSARARSLSTSGRKMSKSSPFSKQSLTSSRLTFSFSRSQAASSLYFRTLSSRLQTP